MSRDEYMQKIAMEALNSRYGCFGNGLRIAILVVVAIIMLSSCATKTKIEYRDRIVDHYNTIVQHDTLREHTSDSIFEKIYVKGDTIYDTKYVEKTKWRDRVVYKTDTCYRDSVYTHIRESVKEKQIIPKWCYFCLVVCAIFIIFAIRKFIRWLQTI